MFLFQASEVRLYGLKCIAPPPLTEKSTFDPNAKLFASAIMGYSCKIFIHLKQLT